MKNRILLLIVILFLSRPSFAKQWIIFSSQAGLEPHAFALFIKENPVTKIPEKVGCWGFNPKDYPYIPLFYGKGTLSDNSNKTIGDYFIAEVTDEEWKLGLTTVEQWKNRFYGLATNNCIDFLTALAQNLKFINLPNRRDNYTPGLYVGMLRRLNEDWHIHSKLSNDFSISRATQLDNNKSLSDKEENKGNFIIDKNHKPYKYALFYTTPSNQLALLGKYPIGVNVNILNNKTGNSIWCKTTSVKKYESALTGDAVVTTLDKSILVKNLEEYSFTAVFTSNNASFKLITRTLVADLIKIQNLDSKIKQRGYLETLLKQYDQAKFAAGYLDILKSKGPIVYHLNILGADINVITYKFSEYEIGPRFIEINSKITPLSGQCSFLDFQAYKYGNNYFIKSNSGACESGYIIAEIFEIREDSLIKEFSNSGYSN